MLLKAVGFFITQASLENMISVVGYAYFQPGDESYVVGDGVLGHGFYELWLFPQGFGKVHKQGNLYVPIGRVSSAAAGVENYHMGKIYIYLRQDRT